jgi:rhodanese-related sulfurtransferase
MSCLHRKSHETGYSVNLRSIFHAEGLFIYGEQVVAVTLPEMRGMVRDPAVRILDVLSRQAYAAAHIPGARNIPLAELPDRAVAELPGPSFPIVVYCGGPT